MSDLYKPKNAELAAVMLAAAFVFMFLAIRPFQQFINAYWNYRVGNYPSPSDTIAAIGLVIFSFQAWIYFGQWRLMSQQAAIQKAQHIALNRPRIIVREVQKWTNKHDSEGRACIHFCVVNIGASEATPISSIYRSDILSEKRSPFTLYPQTLESGFPENFLGRDAIGPQHVFAFTVPSESKERDLMSVEARWIKGEKTDDIWVFHGLIVYADGNGTTYRTSFWRVYNFTTRRFVPTEDTDYEHAH